MMVVTARTGLSLCCPHPSRHSAIMQRATPSQKTNHAAVDVEIRPHVTDTPHHHSCLSPNILLYSLCGSCTLVFHDLNGAGSTSQSPPTDPHLPRKRRRRGNSLILPLRSWKPRRTVTVLSSASDQHLHPIPPK